MFIHTCELIESKLNRYRGMNVLQNTFFDYNIALSQYLEARRRRTSSQTSQFSATNSKKIIGDSGNFYSIVSCSPSPPIATATAAIDSANKSFTIDAILGLSSESNCDNSGTSEADTALDFSNSSNKKFSRIGVEKSSRDVKSNGKSKRVRTIFTPEQLERLEAEFERQQYMVGPERLYLAHTLKLTEAQVKVWFQNRRIKWRKQHLEMTQQRLDLLRQHREQKLRQVRPKSDSNEDDSE